MAISTATRWKVANDVLLIKRAGFAQENVSSFREWLACRNAEDKVLQAFSNMAQAKFEKRWTPDNASSLVREAKEDGAGGARATE